MSFRFVSRNGPQCRALLTTSLGAVLALVFASSASALSISVPNDSFTLSAATSLKWTTSSSVLTCSGLSGTGTWNNLSSGTLTWTQSGCRDSNSNTCTTPGAVSGTIVKYRQAYDLVWLDSAHTTWGMRLRPNFSGNPFIEYDCGSGLQSIGGPGLLGRITYPALNTTTSSFGLQFEMQSTYGLQKYQTIPGDPTTYNMLLNTTTPVALVAAIPAALSQPAKFLP